MENIQFLQARRLLKPHKDTENLHSKFWFNRGGYRYMFKLPTMKEDCFSFRFSLFNEVFISKMCQRLGVKCQDAEFAEYKIWHEKGVLIKSFLARGQEEISLNSILHDYIESSLDEMLGVEYFEKFVYPVLYKSLSRSDFVDLVLIRFSADEMRADTAKKLEFLLHLLYEKGNSTDVACKFPDFACDIVYKNKGKIVELNNLLERREFTEENVVFFAKFYAKKHNLALSPDVEDELSKYALFDYLVSQIDRNTSNISFVKEGNKLELAPLFDNGLCFPMTRKQDERKFDTLESSCGKNILLSDMTKSRLADKNSPVFTLKERIFEFLENEYTDFVVEFFKNNPNCAEFIFDEQGKSYTNDDVLRYMLLAQNTMKERLNALKNEKKRDFDDVFSK